MVDGSGGLCVRRDNGYFQTKTQTKRHCSHSSTSQHHTLSSEPRLITKSWTVTRRFGTYARVIEDSFSVVFQVFGRVTEDTLVFHVLRRVNIGMHRF